MNVRGHNLRFGYAEWIGVAGLCLTPAMGFAVWAINQNAWAKVTEARVDSVEAQVASHNIDHDLLIRVDARTAASESLLKDLAARMDRATATERMKAGQ